MANKKKVRYKKAYIPLLEDESLEWRWEEKKVRDFDELWRLGYNIYTIANYFDRDPDEVLILAIDRVRSEKISQRAGGLLGTIT
jgi:hypothetical protein